MVILTALCRSDRPRIRCGRAGVAAIATLLGLGALACAGAGDEAAPAAAIRTDTVADHGPADTTAAGALPRDTVPAATGRWLFLVFRRPIVDADLRWLEESDFRVDSLLGPTTLRGRLLRADTGAGAIAADPRIESVEPLMR